MKRILSILLLLALTPALFSCAVRAKENHFLFEETEDGWAVAGVLYPAEEIALPSEHEGRPVTAVKTGAFCRSGDLRRLTVPKSIRSIGEYAFADCERLQRVVFEAGGSAEIGESAFENCPRLTTVKFNGAVRSVGERAFKSCVRLSAVKAGFELTEIGEDAFMNCERLIVRAEKGSPLSGYAASHRLATGFFSSVYALYLWLGAALIAAAACLALLHVYRKKKRRKNQKKA